LPNVTPGTKTISGGSLALQRSEGLDVITKDM